MDKTIKTIGVAVLVILLGLLGFKACSDTEEPVIIPEEQTEVEVEVEKPELNFEEDYGPDLEEKI